MTKSKWIRLIFSILTVLWMVVIFLFSAQDGETSSETSGKIVEQVAPVVIKDYEHLPESVKQIKVNDLNHVIRKLAHFSEYAILGMLTFFALLWDRIKRLPHILIAFGIGGIYAVTDELHQILSIGRSPAVLDVLIDSAGVLAGTLIAWLIFCLFRIFLRQKRRRKAEKSLQKTKKHPFG
ncbi:MAG: VanZ family protein [Eubacteriales bacterium]